MMRHIFCTHYCKFNIPEQQLRLKAEVVVSKCNLKVSLSSLTRRRVKGLIPYFRETAFINCLTDATGMY